MKRRCFEKIMGAAAFLPSLVFAGRRKQPNLLVIHTDEHNFRTLGCYRETLPKEQALMWGDAVVETPHIDRLAKEGAICTRFYATSPVCTPSRGSFMSGMYPQNNGAIQNDVPMGTHVVTFAEVLRRHGYATGYAGKWHLAGDGKPQWDPEPDFGFRDNQYMFNRGHWKLLELTAEGPQVGMKNGQPSYVPIGTAKTFTTDWLADRAIEFVSAHRDEPFCYVVSIPDPHGPDTVRAPYDTMFRNQTYRKPRNAPATDKDQPSWARITTSGYNQSLYYGMVKCIDDNVGKILRFLEQNNLMENTIIVFTSDHGDLRGEHGRQNKGVPFEASAKIPFLIRWPEKIRAGLQVEHVLACTDFKATILDLMNIPLAGGSDGRNASWMFTERPVVDEWENTVYLRAVGQNLSGWLAAFTERYKLVVSGDNDPWLYDLEQDPDELVNFFNVPECRDVVRDLGRKLLSYGKNHNEPRIGNKKILADLTWCSGPDLTYSNNTV